MVQVFEEILGKRLAGVTYIRGVYDFKAHLHRVRPRAADRGIQTQFGLQFRLCDDESAVMVRSKNACSLWVEFGPWIQMLPHRSRPDAVPDRDVVPPVLELKEWEDFPKVIAPSLSRFYKEKFCHPVHIPVEIKDEMLLVLSSGPGPATPLPWIEWGDPPAAGTSTALPPSDSGSGAAAAAREPRGRRRAVWGPFLAPRMNAIPPVATASAETSNTQVTSASAETILAPPRTSGLPPVATASAETASTQVATASAVQDKDANKSTEPFPYPVGPWVAVDFRDAGLYAGQIAEIYDGYDLCRVEFTDGDAGDYEADEITYAVQLYERDFKH